MHADSALFPLFYHSLPIAGRDGTIARRMRGSAAEGNLRAKTGSLAGVSSLSGYVRTAEGELLAFSVLMQDFPGGTDRYRAVQNRIGALLASLIGTTGASMLLIRPLLRATAARRHRAHAVIFFIFVVSNAGGLLTPLGDPPLFLGFLRGVPFGWTLGLWRPWLLVNGLLLAIFLVADTVLFRREGPQAPPAGPSSPLRLAGTVNLLYLAGVVVVLVASGVLGLPAGVQEGGMLLLAGLSLLTTPRALREENGFSWAPIAEVALLFAGIFATMIPALAILNSRGAELGLVAPWQYFWASGALSSFLDNAPTYLTFASTASGVMGTDASNLAQLVATDRGASLLAAISMGSVLMGANTYVGNGPNFMVKAIAEQGGVRMPGFLGYMACSATILLPIFAAVTWVFLR
jgi:Na+/H+ antiporter NhaD/arsenite permease-like protein